jgi:hypothetical protein
MERAFYYDIEAGDWESVKAYGLDCAAVKEDGRWEAFGDVVGERLLGTTRAKADPRHGELIAFDADLPALAYPERMAWLQGSGLPCVTTWLNASIDELKAAWQYVLDHDLEGLILVPHSHKFGDPMFRMKRIETEDYKVIAVDGGTLVGESKTGGRCRVGIGYTLAERAAWSSDPSLVVGRWFEAIGNQKFSSGALRHPRFGRWRDDKND